MHIKVIPIIFYKATLMLAAFALSGVVSRDSATQDSNSRTQTGGTEERKVEILPSRRLPVIITAVRNLEVENWLKEMEIEVKNISDKPIYYLLVQLKFPDIPKTTDLDGIERGYAIPLEYGDHKLMRPGQLSTDNDSPINPGQKYVLKVGEQYWKGLEYHLSLKTLPASIIRRVRLRVISISFGDGTGFNNGAPFPTNPGKQGSIITSKGMGL